MTLTKALLYFAREATVSLVRSWKVSLVAVLTIAMSLFMGGLVFLVTENLSRAAEGWGEELRVTLYLEEGTSADEELLELIGEPVWVSQAQVISAQQARERFERSFPSLADLLSGWDEEPLPSSIEIRILPERLVEEQLENWLERLRQHPATTMLDDDRDWLEQLAALVIMVRAVGLTLGVSLLGAAIFTIASVVKLTAYLYLDEIAVMRLVGATEFFIRGPFYSEGLLQGLLGGGLALAALYAAAALFEPAEGSVWLPLLLGDFLPWPQQLMLVALGGAAGLLGAVLSLRRESLKAEGEH